MTHAQPATADLFAPLARPYPDGVPAEVCDLFEALALQVHSAGLDRYSARAILHRLRWHHRVERGNRDFKIDNRHSAPLARWFIAKHPEMPEFFELREARADD